jgi:hypothetical protein
VIRLTLLWAYILFVAGYAWKDWFKALCGLVLLMGVIEHPDMPKSMFGIQGMNPWNVLMLDILLAWFLSRRREGLSWDMPVYVNVLLMLYATVMVIGFGRLMSDRTRYLQTLSTGYLVGEYLVNTMKWVIPGLLFFDGARTRQRFLLGLAALLGMYFILGLQVIKWMPASSALSGAEMATRSLKILMNEVGFHRVNLSMMLGGASWAIFATYPLARTRWPRVLILLASLLTLYAQALTAGRTGYATWAVVGFVLCMLRWRKYLLLAPVVAVLVIWLVPGVTERMTQGFGTQEVVGEDTVDDYVVTAGRTLIWPYVIDKIGENPVFGFGRQAMIRTGLSAFLQRTLYESFPHPHNAYLEMLLDNGIIGMLLVMPFYITVLVHAGSLFLDSRSPVFIAIGGATLGLVLALLVAAVGSQTFYPREGAVGMWCAIGLTFRVSRERARVSSRRFTASRSSATATAPAPATPTAAPPAGRRPAAGWQGANVSRRPAAAPLAAGSAMDEALWTRAS